MEMGFMSSHPSVPSSAKLAIALGVAIRRFFVFGGACTPSFCLNLRKAQRKERARMQSLYPLCRENAEMICRCLLPWRQGEMGELYTDPLWPPMVYHTMR